ncbi:glucosamine-6-phosphate deaminase [Shouchella lehensis]|uniref:Glucosamine-6-phosphate deaminase n=1 Tax=Shouchella lehensis TaxID=300825 RepID=A0A4Y7WI67_9BACI|nr:glucosamine-6-phosphate deaminase [Shouchella lehensis]MBG9785499.1 glucosamine-6-phosphate deaminase [Shouchella lehensis]TES47936.1 glucosamine-6-phosphate deaminase [Shouchella lehensis]
MKIVYVKDYDALSEAGASFLLEQIKKKPSLTMGLATGGTPKGTYEKLINKSKKEKVSFEQVRTFNLDEYVGLSKEDPNSYHQYMNDMLFNHIDIKSTHTFIPNGEASSIEAECQDYEQRIKAAGGIDIQLLGIGNNGHIGFNEPGTNFSEMTHMIELADATREANARYFNTKEDVPKQAITMGIASIMAAKEILLLISGKDKQHAFSMLLEDGIDEAFPASILKEHPHVTVIVDQEAAGQYFNESA